MFDPTRQDILDIIAADESLPEDIRAYAASPHEGATAEAFEVESAIYWFAADWHSGQWSNLYSVLSCSAYRPGCREDGPEEDSTAAEIYAILEAEADDE